MSEESPDKTTVFLAGAFLSFIATTCIHLFFIQPGAVRKGAQVAVECFKKELVERFCVNQAVEASNSGGTGGMASE